jgi:hypothetical protein
MDTRSATPPRHASAPLSQRADALERRMMEELDRVVVKSVVFTSGELDPTVPRQRPDLRPGQYFLMGDDPRLQQMPEKPTLLDFFRYRFAPVTHLLQSANLALKAGHGEKVIIACLLHDVAVAGFIRADHGYWGAQLLEPYVDEEVSWAIRAHQALRFFPDPAAGYEYPEAYIRNFGREYEPEPYIKEEYERARKHRWYMTARYITINDIYAFDPNVVVHMEDFVDIVGRNFRQPKEGLGLDNSPVAHMWRTIWRPTRYL